MVASLDVAARLDEGHAAVDTIAEYVWACHLLGFDHPDLTRYRCQVRDGYAAEDGLDLRVLDAECTSLAAAAAAAERALQLQDNQFQSLTQAWQGAGARASTDFLGRHATSAAQVASGIAGAAATLGRLRDQLWDAVDAKVAAVLQIEARQAGRRGIWLAAAHTVNTGMGDRSAASELIDTQVKPFVVNDIGGDWVMAMRSTSRAVADAYAHAVTALRTEVSPVFGIPGDLGPVWHSSTPESRHPALALAADTADRSSVAGARGGFTAAPQSAPSFAAPAVMVPAGTAAGAPVGMPGVGPEPIVPAGAPSESVAPALASPTGLGQGLGGGGLPGLGGMPDIGSGLAGSGQQLADLLGGLIGSSAGDLPEGVGEMTDDDVGPVADDDGHGEGSDEESDEPTTDEGGTDDSAVDQPSGPEDPDAEVTESQPDSPPAATEVPEAIASPPAAPGPAAAPLVEPAGGTPCEIAADELPQVGG